MAISKDYLKKLRERAKKSRLRTRHQFVGLKISKDLGDEKHKSLYMKLSKEGNPAKLEWLAADITNRKNVEKKGAYFMRVLTSNEKEAREWLRGGKQKRTEAATPKIKRRKKNTLFPSLR